MFWGCTIPARFPFIEKATRLALHDLGAEPVDLAGFTCCPEATLVRSADEEVFYLTAARNLALAEEQGLPLLTPCNGCYSTFKSVLADLKVDWRLRDSVNQHLAAAGLSLSGDLEVWHLVEWLSEDLGPAALVKNITKPLWGMRLAVHYGCHLLRPSPAVRWDSSTAPTKFEALVRALGATVVDYPTKMDCCGNALDRVGRRQDSLSLLERKLSDVRAQEADALVVSCPSCFLQFDLNQAAQSRSTGGDLPVFYITELIALAMGHKPEDLGLARHRVEVAPFLEKWETKLKQRRALAETFDVGLLQTCASCGACDADCPVTQAEPDFVPSTIVRALLKDGLQATLENPDVWRCTDCMTCFERCHSRIGMAEMFEKLKRLAQARGLEPAAVRANYEAFLASGTLGSGRAAVRDKLGLPPLPEGGADDWKAVLAGEKDKS